MRAKKPTLVDCARSMQKITSLLVKGGRESTDHALRFARATGKGRMRSCTGYRQEAHSPAKILLCLTKHSSKHLLLRQLKRVRSKQPRQHFDRYSTDLLAPVNQQYPQAP